MFQKLLIKIATCTAKYRGYHAWDGTLQLGIPVRIEFADAGQCNTSRHFFVDSALIKIYLMMDSAGKETPILKVYNPEGELVNFPKPFAANESRVGYEVEDPTPGIWSVKFTSSHACLFLVHANTKFTINAGFISGPDARFDDPSQDMTEKQQHFYIAHANFLEHPGHIQKLEIWERNDESGRFEMKKELPGFPRENCQHDVYFGPFSCSRLNSVYYFKIIGVDGDGYVFERTRTIRCLPKKED